MYFYLSELEIEIEPQLLCFMAVGFILLLAFTLFTVCYYINNKNEEHLRKSHLYDMMTAEKEKHKK